MAGTILVAGITSTPDRAYALAVGVLAVIGLFGLLAAFRLPNQVEVAPIGDPVAPTRDG